MHIKVHRQPVVHVNIKNNIIRKEEYQNDVHIHNENHCVTHCYPVIVIVITCLLKNHQ